MVETNGNLPRGFKNRLDLSRHATPRPLRKTPVHNWFVFPHSYSHVLVDTLIDHWDLNERSRIYDPFVGAGTTLLSAKGRGISAVGGDISPLAIFVANAKVAPYEPKRLLLTWNKIERAMQRLRLPRGVERQSFLQKALELETHQHLERIRRAVVHEADGVSRKFFLLALLRLLPHYSRALPDGGWFRWRRVRASAATISKRFARTVKGMLADLQPANGNNGAEWRAYKHDARLPLAGHGRFDGLISSPPYPNRHDYTRIFTTELLFLFLQDDDDLKQLRYQNFRSHVEARANELGSNGWKPPKAAEEVLDKLSDIPDKRVPRMVRGYFEDMYLTLAASKHIVKRGGHLAFVVGNVQHAGVHVPVDDILAKIGEQVALTWNSTWVIRLRGNSAQQMGRFGRRPTRESIVLFDRT